MHLTNGEGVEKAFNGQSIVTVATYGKTASADGGHKAAAVTVNPTGGVTVSAVDYPQLTAEQLAPYAGSYTLTLSSATVTNSVADGTSRMRMVKEANVATVYSTAAGGNLGLSITITPAGLIQVESGTAALNPSYNVWTSFAGSDTPDYSVEESVYTNYTITGSITATGLASA